MKTNLEKEIDNLINIFIEKWIPKSYQHLIDTDENDGEALRDNIKELIDEAKQEERERIKKEVEKTSFEYINAYGFKNKLLEILSK